MFNITNYILNKVTLSNDKLGFMLIECGLILKTV